MTLEMTTREHDCTREQTRASLRPLSFAIFGGMLDTGNLGVAALGTSALKNLRKAFPDCHVLMQSVVAAGPDARGACASVALASGQAPIEPTGVYPSATLRGRAGTGRIAFVRKITRPLPGGVGRKLAGMNRTLEQLMRADVILDVAGGDSFADIYGPEVMGNQAALKMLAATLGKPLVLLPQTFGPFTDPRSMEMAREIINGSLLAATRDKGGLDELQKLLGGRLPGHIVPCPDMAFTLDPIAVAHEKEKWLFDRKGSVPLVGLNVSGLLYFGKKQFGIEGSHAELMEAAVDWAISRGAQVLLVPHVISLAPLASDQDKPEAGREPSDTLACQVLLKELRAKHGDKVGCLAWGYTASETKWLAGQCDLMIGARMHACIGTISQGVPTATLAYSKKAAGVMGHLAMDHTVVDLRSLDNAAAVQAIDALWNRRGEIREQLDHEVPRVQKQVEAFFGTTLRDALTRAGIATGERLN